jgi:hypothetical protein
MNIRIIGHTILLCLAWGGGGGVVSGWEESEERQSELLSQDIFDGVRVVAGEGQCK